MDEASRSAMRQTGLPGTDLHVSALAMGCWPLSGDRTWGPQEEASALEAVQAALDAGINLFDTAPMYGDGLSTRRLGRALRGRRDRAVVADKIPPGAMDAAGVRRSCERSLEELQTDWIDLYQIHWPSREVPLEETWGALERLQEEGKVRALGVCNFGPGDLADLFALRPRVAPATDQLPYGLLTRSVEYEIVPACRDRQVGVLAYSPLLLGVLTGKWMDADEVPAGRARTRHFAAKRPEARHGEAGCEEETFEAVQRVRTIAREMGRPMEQVALAWTVQQPGVSSVLVGLRKRRQVERNVAAASMHLDQEALEALQEATEPVKEALGKNADLWEGRDRSRYR